MRISHPLPVLALALTFTVPAVAFDGFVGCSNSDDWFPFDPVTYVSGAAIDLLPEGNYPYDATISPGGGHANRFTS